MSKINIVIVILLIIAVIANGVQYVTWSKAKAADAAAFQEQADKLQAQANRFGSDATVWTLKNSVTPGTIVVSDMFESVTWPSNLVTEQMLTDTATVLGKEFKIAVNPGTPLTKNMFMDSGLEDSTRDRDLVLDRYTVGLHPGDYIDIRMTMPYGDDYVVIPRIRIWEVNDNTLKVHLTETQWMQYQGAFIDYCLNRAYGCTLYADKYVEPGLQQQAVAYYAVPTNIAALVQKNPNILTPDKNDMEDLSSWRQSIEELLVIFRDEEDTVDADASKLSAARSEVNAAVVADAATARSEYEDEMEQNQGDEEASDDEWDWDESATDTNTEIGG